MNKKLTYFSTVKFLSRYILAYKKNYILLNFILCVVYSGYMRLV